MSDESDNSTTLDESFCSPNVNFMEVLRRKQERLKILQEMAEKQEEGLMALTETKKLKSKSKPKIKSSSETKRKVNTNFPTVALRRSLRFQKSPKKSKNIDIEVPVKHFVPREFIPLDYGPIPGVEVGDHWETRLQCSAAGVHRPTVAGIHAGPKGAYSVALSGGYPEDVDNGVSFVYTGAGGRDLKGTVNKPKNLRIAPQTKDQELEGTNASLLTSIYTKNPVRVIRGYKSFSCYAPETGYRYDGLYQVVSYWEDVGATGFRVYRFVMERLKDQSPPPWESQPLSFSATSARSEIKIVKNESLSSKNLNSEFKENIRPDDWYNLGSRISSQDIKEVDNEIFLQIKFCIEKSGNCGGNLKENSKDNEIENFTGWDQS